MNWLHNLILLTISFLISRLLVDSGLHHLFVQNIIRRSRHTFSALVTGILFISYGLSLVFSNTVVAITMIPVISGVVEGIRDISLRNRAATHFILALIYGANIGGMGSLTGTYLNVVSVSYLDILGIAGARDITYFSWLIIGVPVSLLLLLGARLVLIPGEKKLAPAGGLLISKEPEERGQLKKYSGFFFLNLALFIFLTALQFFLRPDPVWGPFNIIDIIFLAYLGSFIFFAFLFPRGSFRVIFFGKNSVFFILFTFLFPVIFINETAKDIKKRFHLPRGNMTVNLDAGIKRFFNAVWFPLFGEKWGSLRLKNRNAYISANRIIFDLPFFGLVFMGLVLLGLVWIISLGNNPATPELDGYVFHFLENLTSNLIIFKGNLFWLFFTVILTSVFLTEAVSNTTVVLVTFPIIAGMAVSGGFNPFFLLLALAVASNGAFMTPVATSVNAVSFAGIPGISLKSMLSRGFFLNVSSAVYFSAVFFALDLLVYS